MLYPPKEIANFKTDREKAVNKTLLLVAYPLPDKGYRYPIRRGSGLFIYLLGVWRCLLRDKQESFHAFFVSSQNVKSGMEATQKKQMEKLLKYLMLLLVTTLSLTFTACGGDDNDEPNTPGGGSSATKFEVKTFTIDNGASVSIYFVDEYGADLKFCNVDTRCDYNTDYNEIIGFSSDYYSRASNIRMAKCKNVSSLSQITSLSGVSWIDERLGNSLYTVNADCFSLEEKTGYILEGTLEGRTYYIRIYISEFNRNSAGNIIGINGSMQQFQPHPI